MERVKGIEPSSFAWEANILPLYYTRIFLYDKKLFMIVKITLKILIVAIVLLSSLQLKMAILQAAENNSFDWEISNQEAWQSPDGNLQINFYPQQQVTIIPLGLPSLPQPWQPLTSAYEIKTFSYIKEVLIKGGEKSYLGTAVLVKVEDTWVELNTKLNEEGWRVVGKAGSAIIVLARHPNRLQGVASWYRYKNCLCAASRHYPKGMQLEVSRADNPYKKIMVKINDYGPEEWTSRVLDLDVVAFKQLGNKRGGLMTVMVKPR